MGEASRLKYQGCMIYLYAIREVGDSTISYVGLTNNPSVRLLAHTRYFGNNIEMLILERYKNIDTAYAAEDAWITYFYRINSSLWNGRGMSSKNVPSGINVALINTAECISIDMASAVVEYEKIIGYRHIFSHVDSFLIDGVRYSFAPASGTICLIWSWRIAWFRLPEVVQERCNFLFNAIGLHGTFAENMVKLQRSSGLDDSGIFIAALWFVEFLNDGLPEGCRINAIGGAHEVAKLRKVFGRKVKDFYRDWNSIVSQLNISEVPTAPQPAQKGSE